MDFIIKNVKCSTIFVDGIDKQVQTVKKLFEKLGDKNPIKYIVFSDNISFESRKSISSLSAEILTCSELFNLGANSTVDVNTLIDQDENMENIAVLMYTSGSTGMPKGVCLKRLNIIGGMEIASTVLTPYLKTKNPVL